MPIFIPADQMPQGSPAWIAARLGIPTASCFERIVTPKGAISAARDKYLNTLLAERMTGRALQEATTAMMQRGKDWEAEAVAYYELLKNTDTQPIGFVLTDDRRYGASPDRIISLTQGLECKVPSWPTHVGYLRAVHGAGDEYKIQAQGQMLVCGFESVDIISYCPDMPEAAMRALYTVKRDEEFIGKLAAALEQFCDELEAEAERFRSLGWITGHEDEEKPEESADWLAGLGVSLEDIPNAALPGRA